MSLPFGSRMKIIKVWLLSHEAALQAVSFLGLGGNISMDSPADGHYVTGNALGLFSSIIGNWYCSHTASTSISKKGRVPGTFYISTGPEICEFILFLHEYLDPIWILSFPWDVNVTKQDVSIYGLNLKAWVVVVRPNCLGTKVGTLTYSHVSFKYQRLIHTSNSFLQNSDIRARTLKTSFHL